MSDLSKPTEAADWAASWQGHYRGKSSISAERWARKLGEAITELRRDVKAREDTGRAPSYATTDALRASIAALESFEAPARAMVLEALERERLDAEAEIARIEATRVRISKIKP